MKNFKIIISVLILALNGCAAFDRVYHRPIPDMNICEQPGAEASIICRVCHEIGTEPEQLDGLILDSSMIAIFADKNIDKRKILQFIDKLESFLNIQGLTYHMVIRFVENEARAEALSILLSRRLKNFDLPDVIGSFDLDLIRKHLDNQRHQLGGLAHR